MIIITALIGIFAISQVIEMLAKGRVEHKVTSVHVEAQSLFTSIKLLARNLKALSIGTVVGSIIGLIPGVGGQIAGLLAYDQTRKFSKDRDSFGKGNAAGVIAAESANNAMVGPSLVPLLTLSIPGSPTAAVLLVDLLIVPTMMEAGFDVDNASVNFCGVMVPAGTDPEIIAMLAEKVPAMFASGRVAKQMSAGGSPVKIMSREEVQQMWEDRQETLTELLAGIK